MISIKVLKSQQLYFLLPTVIASPAKSEIHLWVSPGARPVLFLQKILFRTNARIRTYYEEGEDKIVLPAPVSDHY